MERTREVKNPDRFVAGETRMSKALTAIKNAILKPSLGYIKPSIFESSPSTIISHSEDCLNPQVNLFPIFGVIALPQMAGPISEYKRKDMQLARCDTCKSEQVIKELKGGE